jgi:transposase
MWGCTSNPILQEDAVGKATLRRGDRRRNEKLARLRAVVRGELAIMAIDLAKAKQAVVVLDHDSQVVGRRMFACSPWGLGQALAWAEDVAAQAGFDGGVTAFEPTGHRWKPLWQLCADRGVGAVCVQPLVVHHSREAEDFTRDRSDFKDAVIIGRLAAELRGYLPQAPQGHWARLGHLGTRRDELVVRATAARQGLCDLLEVAWPAALGVCAKPTESRTWRAAMMVATDPGEVAAMAYDAYEQAVRVQLAAVGASRLQRRIIAALWKAAHQPGGIDAERAAAAERAGFVAGDWQRALAELGDVEARMVGALDAVGLTELATSIPGVSAVGAAAILAETGDPTRYDSARAWVKHAGLCPRDNDSGTFQGHTRVSGRGRPRLRTAAWRAVWGALPHNPVFAAKHHHLTTRAANPLADEQARAAVAAALLRQLHAVCTQRMAWDPAIAAGTHPQEVTAAA